MAEQPTSAALTMDRGLPIGNSPDTFGRRSAHVKVGNLADEPIPTRHVVDAFALALSSSWLSLGVPDEFVPTISVDGLTTTFAIKEQGVLIAEAIFFFESVTNQSVVLKRYLVDDDGSQLLNDDGVPLTLD